jgi:hypothetical protein
VATNHGVGGSNPSSPTPKGDKKEVLSFGGREIMIGIVDAKPWNLVFTKGSFAGPEMIPSTPESNQHIRV